MGEGRGEGWEREERGGNGEGGECGELRAREMRRADPARRLPRFSPALGIPTLGIAELGALKTPPAATPALEFNPFAAPRRLA